MIIRWLESFINLGVILNKFIVGYVRVSVKDNGNSIGNQISLIKDYCNSNNLKLDDIYVDNGISGIDFSREAFLKLKKDIELGLISTVIVKDISRLGRELFLSSYYINEYFKLHNVLLISINNEDTTNRVLVNIHSIMNDYYVKEASLKRRNVAINKTLNHEFIGPYPPFGYDIFYFNGLRTLSINENEASIVKDIFNLNFNGYSLNYIAVYLNNILLDALKVKNKKTATNTWNNRKVRRILENPVYKGDLVVRKSYKYNYKDKKRKYIRPSDYQIIENVFPSIVDKELFLQVNNRLKKYKNYRKAKEKVMFENKVFCNKCGNYMRCYQKHKNNKLEYYFKCSKCLKSIILKKILVAIDENISNLVADVNKRMVINNCFSKIKCYIESIKDSIREKIRVNDLKLKEAYIKNYSGEITQQDFKKVKKSIDNKKKTLLKMFDNVTNFKMDDIDILYKNSIDKLVKKELVESIYIDEQIIVKYSFH